MIMLHQVKPQRVLETVLEQSLPLAVSYLSGEKWRLCRALVSFVGENEFGIRISPQKKDKPLEIFRGQSVGITFKYGYGQDYDHFIFDTTITSIEQSGPGQAVGMIKLAVPSQIEVVQRRSFQRVRVPKGTNVDVELWIKDNIIRSADGPAADICQGYIGTLIDISAGGLQVAVDYAQGPSFEEGQFIGLKFTPVPNQTQIMFNAYIRNVLPTASGSGLCIGLELVGLEASPEGRLILQRICSAVDYFTRLNKQAQNQ